MQKQIKEIKIGSEIDFAAAIIIDLGFPGAPKIITLATRGTTTEDQKIDLLKSVETYRLENQADYSLIAKDSIGYGFRELVSPIWRIEHTLNSYQLSSKFFKALHEQIPEKIENLSAELLLEYIQNLHQISLDVATESLKTLQEKWQQFSSTVYAQIHAGQIVSAAEVHANPDNSFSIDMLGTVESQKNKGFATQLYSYLVGQILEKNLEHVGVTDSDNQPMQRIFQKLGGVLLDIQTTWSGQFGESS